MLCQQLLEAKQIAYQYSNQKHFSSATQLLICPQELLSFSGGGVGAGVVVECRTKSATLLGFVWADQDDLVLVTSHGVEFYHVRTGIAVYELWLHVLQHGKCFKIKFL